MNFAGSLSLITLGCVLCASALAGGNHVTKHLPAARQSPSVSPSPTPQPRSEEKRPNAVRRFFSWTADQLAWPFRKETRSICRLPPSVGSISVSKSLITFCPTTGTMSSNLSCSPDREVKLVAYPTVDAEFLYTWTVTGGTIQGKGREATWDLSGLAEGTYTATVEMNDGNQHRASGSTTVTVALCSGCDRPPPPCPSVSVSCPANLASKLITFEAIVEGSDPEMKPSYAWSISAGKIVSGQETSKLIVDTSERDGRSITATVTLSNAHPACTGLEASCTLSH